jgi:hypothetical protein
MNNLLIYKTVELQQIVINLLYVCLQFSNIVVPRPFYKGRHF